MKKFLFFAIALSMAIGSVSAQEATEPEGNGEMAKYRRSSLYSILIKHSSFPYAAEIDSAFMVMPIPDKFNDHNLEVRSFESSAVKMKKNGKAKKKLNLQDTDNFLNTNDVAKALVAKWFLRDPENGGFDMSLIQERGFYDASQLDIATAEESTRGKSSLGDAGEALIGNTFVIVNDITFVDKGEKSARVAESISLIGKILSQATEDKSYEEIGDVAAAITNEIDGFTVNITTYLYRLKWNDEVEGTFYKLYWINKGGSDDTRKEAFEKSDIFSVDYIGQTTTSASNLASKSLSSQSKGQQMLKVCTRAVDKSIVELQREYDEFKVNVPIYKISEDGDFVDVQIGLKEGINEKSKFEVLLPIEGENGKLTYDKVGMIQPLKDKIWDNRFGALEEAKAVAEEGSNDAEAANLEAASLTASTFKILSGANKIVPGCLVREVTIKK